MEPAANFLVAIPFAVFGVWIFSNPEALLKWEPGFRNVEVDGIGRARERIGGLLFVFGSLVLVVLGANTAHVVGILGVIALSIYRFSEFRPGR